MPESDGARRTTPLDIELAEPHTCTPGRRLTLLGHVPFFARLAPEDVARINQSFRELAFQPTDLIYAAGDEARRLYVVLAGKVKVVRHTLGGQDVVLDLLAPGDFFGTLSVLGEDEYPDTASAQTASCVIAVESAEFQEIMNRYPLVALAVLEIVELRLRAARDLIRQLSAEPVESRIAAALVRLAGRMGHEQDGRILIQTPLSRQDLADMVGTTVETASRVITQFRKAGLIQTGRQWIAVLDLEALGAVAGPEMIWPASSRSPLP